MSFAARNEARSRQSLHAFERLRVVEYHAQNLAVTRGVTREVAAGYRFFMVSI